MNNSTLNCQVILADLPPPPPPLSESFKSLYCVFMLLFSLTTLIGNLFVIVAVVMFRSLRKRIYAFVVVVALADIGVAVFVMPFRLYEEWNSGWLLGKWFCLVVNMFDGIFCSASMSILCCLAVERYLAVCKPFLYTKLTPALTAIVIFACLGVIFFVWSFFLVNEFHIDGIEDLVACLSDGACPLLLNLSSALFLSILTFWTPSAVMLYCYWRIFVTANRHLRAIHSTTVSDTEKRTYATFSKRAKAAKTLGIVIGCFFVCWLPFFIVLVGDVVEGHQWSIQLKLFVMWLGYLNSMINPFLYYIFSAEFKAAFKCIVKCSRSVRDSENVFSTTVGLS
ncbi:5-hydroxytryptamine receptor 4-like [Gigantopelta aegis]|uniref:5-hydroxytryptamine receptor 4-like n=1 Tax=Gigantopelta aegis TaxID=1735272 RepID=UPI001B88C192|nr:5-hydroxytryptamine receptor 4-like [Gigantopelta aegis]